MLAMSPRWRVVDDLPRSLTTDDYQAAQQLVQELCLECEIEADRVGFFGSVGFPGISDIDVAIVGDPPRLTRVVEEFDKRCRESGWLRSMFRHSPLFLLEDCVKIAPRLHTLIGLSEPLRGQVFDGVDPIDSGSPFAESYDALLHAIWISFLIAFVAGLGRKGPISARRLLLVHKNLEYSEHYFGRLGASDGKYVSPVQRDSTTIRRLTLEGRDVQHLASDFLDQFEAAQRAFAEFLPDASRPERRGLDRPVVVHGDFVCIRGSSTFVRRFGRRCLGAAPPWLYEATRRFVEGGQGDDDVGEFVRASVVARRSYQLAGLRYPFVGPFGLSPPLVV